MRGAFEMISPPPLGFDLRARYAQFMAYRREAMTKIGARWYDHCKLPARLYWPTVFGRAAQVEVPYVRFGAWRVAAIAPAFLTARRALANLTAPRVLDIGCGNGIFHLYLRSCELKYRETLYFKGIDPAPPEALGFPVHTSIEELPPERFDLIMMSEVAEHLHVQNFVDAYLARLGEHMSAGASLVIGVPNPLAPTVQYRDVTHVQHYPWYDMYAILRFFFEEVEAQRTFFAWSLPKVLLLPVRYVVASALEADWCDGLVFVARKPKTTPG